MAKMSMENELEKIYIVISDLDHEMNDMIENGDASAVITAEGHRKMIASLDSFCEAMGFPCASFDDEPTE